MVLGTRQPPGNRAATVQRAAPIYMSRRRVLPGGCGLHHWNRGLCVIFLWCRGCSHTHMGKTATLPVSRGRGGGVRWHAYRLCRPGCSCMSLLHRAVHWIVCGDHVHFISFKFLRCGDTPVALSLLSLSLGRISGSVAMACLVGQLTCELEL